MSDALTVPTGSRRSTPSRGGGLARIVFDLLPNAAHVHGDRGRVAVRVSPNMFEELFAATGAAWARREVDEQVELACRQRQRCRRASPARATTSMSRSPASISPATSVNAVTGAAGPPQDGLHAGGEFAGRERLRDVVVGAELEPDDAVVFVAARGQHDHRHRALRPQSATDLEPVDLRKHQIKHDEVGPALGRLRSASSPAPTDSTSRPAFEITNDDLAHRRVVLDHEDITRVRSPLRPYRHRHDQGAGNLHCQPPASHSLRRAAGPARAPTRPTARMATRSVPPRPSTCR